AGKTLCGPCKNFAVRRGQRPPGLSVAAVLAPIIALTAGPFALLLLLACLGAQADQGMVLFFTLAGLVPPLVALVLALYALRHVETDAQSSGRSLAFTGLIATVVAGVLIGEVCLMALRVAD